MLQPTSICAAGQVLPSQSLYWLLDNSLFSAWFLLITLWFQTVPGAAVTLVSCAQKWCKPCICDVYGICMQCVWNMYAVCMECVCDVYMMCIYLCIPKEMDNLGVIAYRWLRIRWPLWTGTHGDRQTSFSDSDNFHVYGYRQKEAQPIYPQWQGHKSWKTLSSVALVDPCVLFMNYACIERLM